MSDLTVPSRSYPLLGGEVTVLLHSPRSGVIEVSDGAPLVVNKIPAAGRIFIDRPGIVGLPDPLTISSCYLKRTDRKYWEGADLTDNMRGKVWTAVANLLIEVEADEEFLSEASLYRLRYELADATTRRNALTTSLAEANAEVLRLQLAVNSAETGPDD